MGRKLFALLVAAFFFYVASPLLLPVVMGGLFAILLLPLQEKLETRKFPPRLAAMFLTLGITVVVLVPTSLSLYLAAKAAFQQLQTLKTSQVVQSDWIHAIAETPGMKHILEKINEWYPIGTEELSEAVQDFLRTASLRAADALGGLLAALPGMVMALAVVVVSIYFILMDGRKLADFIRHSTIFSPSQTDRLMKTFEATCRSVLLASFISGSAQAFVETVAVLIAGLPNVLLISVVVFISSFIPVVGTAPVTFGLALHQFISGNTANGILLLISAIIVSTMDNFIRPLFLRGSVNLHPLLAFVAAFGGLQTLGFVGVFLGPILAALFVATMQILLQGEGA